MIKTRYGNASIDRGYYRIVSNEYGFKNQLLHRLIMTEQLGCGIPKNYYVHHIDGNKLNNKIENLQIMTPGEHTSLHRKDITLSDEHKQKISESRNTSGFLNVYKQKNPNCKQGFAWRYEYYEDGKRKAIVSVDINKLEDKVKSKGLEWVVFQ